MLFGYEHYYFFKASIILIKAEAPHEILPCKPLPATGCPETPPALRKQPKTDAREELSSAEGHDEQVRASPHHMQGAMLPVTEQNILKSTLIPADHGGNVKKYFFCHMN